MVVLKLEIDRARLNKRKFRIHRASNEIKSEPLIGHTRKQSNLHSWGAKNCCQAGKRQAVGRAAKLERVLHASANSFAGCERADSERPAGAQPPQPL